MCHMSHVTCQVSGVTCHMSGVMCHLSCVTCRMSPVTCHLSLMPTATATDRPPANFPIIHSRLVCKDQKQNKNQNTRNLLNNKNPNNVKRYANISNMLFDQKSPVHWEGGFPRWHRQTYRQLTDIATYFIMRYLLVYDRPQQLERTE